MGAISPTLPTVGGPRGSEELDVLSALSTIETEINGSLSANGNLTAAPFAPYHTVLETAGRLTSADGTNQRFFTTYGVPAVATNDQAFVRGLVIPASNPWTLTGRTPKLRLAAHIISNTNPNAGMSGTSQVLTMQLVPVTYGGTAGAFALTAGVSAGSLTLIGETTMSFNDFGRSSDFNVPAAGIYMLTAKVSAALPVGFVVNFLMRIELHHV